MTGFLLGYFPVSILVRWMPRYSPCMTTSPPSDAFLVLCTFQDARRAGAADEFPDRPRSARRIIVRDAMGAAWAQTCGHIDRTARNLRIFAARQPPPVSAGEPLSAVECGP